MARSWTTDAPSPDDAVAQAQIAERLRVARSLRDQSMQGASLENVGGHLIGNPYARALSSGLAGFSAGQQEKRAMGDASALAGAQRERLTRALSGAGQQRTPDDMIAYGTHLLSDPATQEVGQFYIQAGQRAKEREATETSRRSEWQQRETTAERHHREAMEAADARAKASRDQRAQADAARLAAMQARGANGTDPYSIPVYTDDGIIWANTRNQTVSPMINPDTGQPYVRSADSVPLQEDLSRGKGRGKEVGKGEGIAIAHEADLAASLPRLEKVVTELHALGEKATYTKAGQLRDAAMRQANMKVPDSAIAREEYMKKIDNEVLPLLRQTFGAQFTLQEGRDLRTTLGDPNKTPEEKDAALRAFIESKRAALETAQRRVNAVTPPAAPPPPGAAPPGLTPEEQAELDQLRQHFRGGAGQ